MKFKTIFTLVMVVALAFVFAACGNNNDTQTNQGTTDEGTSTQHDTTGNGAADTFGEIVTLRVFSMTPDASELMESLYWADILEDKLGIRLEFMPTGDNAEESFALLMESGEIPDLIDFSTHKQVQEAIAAGLLLNLDQHEASLPDVFTNIPGGIRFYRDNVSNETGELYALPRLVSTRSIELGDVEFIPTVRFDHYEALGRPEINTWEDLIPLIADLTAMNPVTEEGQQVFGYGLFSEWDYHGLWQSSLLMNIYGVQNFGFLEINFADNTFTSMFDDNSVYKRFLDFAFTLNQMGLVDPASVTQSFEDWRSKLGAGRYAFSEAAWIMDMFNTEERTAEGIGFMPLLVNDMMIEQVTGPNFIGHEGGWSWAIGANTAHLEHALAYTNFMYSHDGIMRMRYGNPGPSMFWNIDESGQAYRTEASFDPLRQQWNSVMGADRHGTIAWLRERGNLIERDFTPTLPISEEVSALESRVAELTRTLSWQMIFSRDQEEFDFLWGEMVYRAEAMGVTEANAERAQLHTEALQFGLRYMP